MSTLPPIQSDPNVLVQLDLAHKAYEKVQQEIADALNEANRKITEQFNPIYYAAQSVLYEAMGKATQDGFTHRQLCDVMGCDGH